MRSLLSFLCLCLLSFVSSHVTMTPNQATAGIATQIGFQIPHACNATVATYKVEIQLPSVITTAVPVLKAGWSFIRLTGINGSITFIYTASAGYEVYQEQYDRIDIRITMPNTPGVRLGVPVIQYCTLDTLTAWNETTTGAAHPAPGITLLAATDVQFIPTQANLIRTNTLLSQLNDTLLSSISNDTMLASFVASSTVILRSNITSLYQTIDALRADVQTLKTQQGTTTTVPSSSSTVAPTTAPASTSAPTTASSNLGPVFYNSFGSSTPQSLSSDWNKAETLSVIAIILAGLSTLVCVFYITRYQTLEQKYAYLAGTHAQKVSTHAMVMKSASPTSTTPSQTHHEHTAINPDVQIHLPPQHRASAHNDQGIQFHS